MRYFYAVAGIALLVGCGGGASPASTTPPVTQPPAQSVVLVTVAPTPVLAVPFSQRPDFCDGGGRFDFTVDWATTIRETAGLGGNVNFINVSAKDAAGFEIFREPLNFDVNYIIGNTDTKTNHVNGLGQLVVKDMGMCYTLGSGRRALRIVQIANFRDDRGNVQNIQTEFDVF